MPTKEYTYLLYTITEETDLTTSISLSIAGLKDCGVGFRLRMAQRRNNRHILSRQAKATTRVRKKKDWRQFVVVILSFITRFTASACGKVPPPLP